MNSVLLVGLYRKRTSNKEMDQVTKGTTTRENEEKSREGGKQEALSTIPCKPAVKYSVKAASV